MNTTSFHTHTYLCKHASGTPIDYVKQAEKDGCAALGFSDHCPYPDDSVWLGSRMACSEVPDYLKAVKLARETATFPVYWGFECEWYPAYESWYRDYLRAELSAEFLVYGSHWVPDNGDFIYIADIHDHALLSRYVKLTVEALHSGLYDCFAHPDLFLAGFVNLDTKVRSACAEIIAAAVSMDIPMEINGLGLLRTKILGDTGYRSPYPVKEFWEMASDAGARIICNSDAHQPGEVVVGARRAKEFASGIGVTVIDTAEALGFSSRVKVK